MTHVVLAGGGSAGHTSPLIATAQALRELDPAGAVSAVGTARGLETTVVPAAGIELDLVPPVPMPRRPTPDLLRVPHRLAAAVGAAAQVLRERRADVVVGFGGYVSMPVYLAARRLRTPVVVHEGNAVPGLANRVASRFAAAVLTAFPDTPLRGAEYVGMPVRRAISGLDRAAGRAAARALFDLPAEGPVLLVSGGSQGARSINTAVADALGDLLERGVSVLHVLGRANMSADVVAVDAPGGARYRPVAYVEAMEQAYAAADLMLGRSGAGTVVETAMVGLPGVFVPLPHGNGEQERNADALVAAGAVQVVRDAELTPRRLLDQVVPLVRDPDRLAAMAARGRDLVPRDAADRVAERVLQLAAGRR
ncbi:undecaprenyldiphospho-muramoylpentapeptide beta-N-acetylglucosaminyltransferase [Auraticoccus sp. F435]|uniref:UDP-N-acetylglucosamine--N-acetylmuramyl-(pentapeptide) pyrophosphoryl-undecaprenol N-acetylglucosamine transferase n=1 Tax=Auraticoccus cholistanensis TaxID=2656650 RepID=A0A6A9UZA6_9ACTN|nr:undecaprenyldiphospho-muramoylpentapeptide beta-N-acetylglucosaminyltransferase [Auraticoccus cholistanensis]MVA77294.1 undecaprenyldiphospho-muramoylpentapeptide beta-N-acetylglucosaminyltransferase [Auraticoccus cholistanensis]